MKINCTYVNLGLLLLFLCNLGSIHGHFIRFCSSLFVRSCFPTKSEARQVILCTLNSQISSASKNRAPIHHKNAKSLRPGDSLISSSRHGYCGKMFWRFSVLGQSEVRSGTSMTSTCCVVNANILYTLIQLFFFFLTPLTRALLVDCLRVGRSTFCHVILIARILKPCSRSPCNA